MPSIYNTMLIHQFEDQFLSHFAYAIVHNGEMVLIDPSRNPQTYYEFAKQNNANIIAVIETHLHADFVSAHVEISKTTGAKIYMHPLAQPEFPFQPFTDEAPALPLSGFSLQAIHTPGHSPDSICILLKDETGKTTTVFTGDTLFIGDVGRPDLRETTFTQDATREKLARQMFHSIHEKLLKLNDDVLVYPAHGSGSLCGKNLSSATSSTIGKERIANVALQPMSEDAFAEMLLADQPMVPKYFPSSVSLNRSNTVTPFAIAKQQVNYLSETELSNAIIVDISSAETFKQGHIKNAFNIPYDKKFETWLGTIIAPDEPFVLLGENQSALEELTERTIKIGYDKNLKGLISSTAQNRILSNILDLAQFEEHKDDYIIIDVRNNTERKTQPIFKKSIHIPLYQLRERVTEIPTNKPIVIHCGGGNRGATAASILEERKFSVWDLGINVKKFVAEKSAQ